MSFTDILVAILLGIILFVGFLLFIGKVKLVIVYRDEEKPASWPEKEGSVPEEEHVANYMKPVEEEKPVKKAAPKRRGRPRKTVVPHQFPIPPVL
jgi:hypothetical protein